MSDANSDRKAAKKAAKDQAKLEKKRRKQAEKAAGEPDAPQQAADGAAPPPAPSQPTPAERAAAAAEKQVRLQRWRVIMAIVTGILALLTFLFVVRPWERGGDDENNPTRPGTEAPAAPDPGSSPAP